MRQIMKPMKEYSKIFALFIMVGLLVFARQVFWEVGISREIVGQDIYFSFIEGQRLLHGENPYERILGENMSDNQKYATYLPLFYELSYASQVFGMDEFPAWLAFWKRAFLLFNWGTAILLFYAFWRSGFEWGGIFAAAFWLFSRWNLAVMSVAHLDFMAIFFMVASLVVFPKKRWLGLVLFGVSLALKQIGVFILPLYLIWNWHSVKEKHGKELVNAILLVGCVPFLASIYFLVWNAEGFIRSIFFSITRSALNSFQAPSIDKYMDWDGAGGRLFMLALFAFIYWFSSRRQMGRYTGAFLIMSVFVCFNTVLFSQYLLWVVPLTVLLLLDFRESVAVSADVKT